MSELFVLVLEAHHRERNHHRRHALRLGVDLFGDYLLTIEFGRVGQAGTERRFGGAKHVIKSSLQAQLLRRLSAPRRLGCAYHVTSLDAASREAIHEWLGDFSMVHHFPLSLAAQKTPALTGPNSRATKKTQSGWGRVAVRK